MGMAVARANPGDGAGAVWVAPEGARKSRRWHSEIVPIPLTTFDLGWMRFRHPETFREIESIVGKEVLLV